MQIVIEIPEELKRALDNNEEYRLYTESVGHVTLMAIKYGKSLDAVLDEIKAEIEPKCDRINSLASVLPYTAHREIQELLCKIMDLCKAESEEV